MISFLNRKWLGREVPVLRCVADKNGTDVWLNAFIEQIIKLLEDTEVTLQGNFDDIEEALINAQQAILRYNI